jgi:superfamily II DNA or RNA helicase
MVEVKPDRNDWILPNRKGFLDWTYKTFSKTNYPPANAKGMYIHQRFVRDFLQFHSPYRGLLLFHQLGSGKTASSIAAAEGFVRNNKKVIVMVPASLQNNYRSEIMAHASVGRPKRKVWVEVDLGVTDALNLLDIDAKFAKKLGVTKTRPNKAIVYPGNMIPPNFPKLGVLRETLSWDTLTDAEREQAKLLLAYFIDKRYTFINYNGMNSKAAIDRFNDAIDTYRPLVVIDEAHNFISRVLNGTTKVARDVYNKILYSRTAKVIMLTGTPVINHPYELAYALNLVRGRIPIHVYTVLSKGVMPTVASDVREAFRAASASDLIDEVMLDREKRQIKIAMRQQAAANDAKQAETLVFDILHATYSVDKRVKIEDTYALPPDQEEFNQVFMDVTDPDNPVVKNMDIFMRRIMGLVSYVKTVGESMFPTVLPRTIEEIPMAGRQFQKYKAMRMDEIKLESNNKRNARGKPAAGVFAKQGTVYRAFSRMMCNFVFPESINRPFPKDLKNVQKEIAEADDAVDEEVEEKTTTYESKLVKVLAKLRDNGDAYLNMDDLQNNYSPKMAKIMGDIHGSTGKVLLYSQFRTVEGLGVMRLILEHEGFIEVMVEKKKNGEWTIVDPEEVLKPKYDGKRFIVFNPDREITQVLMQLYNFDMDGLRNMPASLQPFCSDNLRGNFIKMIMITQSGAEGISLKCVRHVMIMEPFWNMVRIDQVIGRAVRANSHVKLPPDEQNVSVTVYTSVFTSEQSKDVTLNRQDGGITTDTHILEIAEKKNAIIQQFLNHLKQSAVDCRMQAKDNQILNNGMQCYAFPLPYDPLDFAYRANLVQDIVEDKDKARLIRNKKIQGRVQRSNGQKIVVVDDYPDKQFEYDAYKDAGVLVEI